MEEKRQKRKEQQQLQAAQAAAQQQQQAGVGVGVGVGGALGARARAPPPAQLPTLPAMASPTLALAMPNQRMPFQTNLVGPPGPSPNQVSPLHIMQMQNSIV